MSDYSVVKSGPAVGEWARFAAWALIVAAAIALCVTVGAATVDPGLAQSSSRHYQYSGFAMTIADLLVLAGIAGLATTNAIRGGWLKRCAFFLAIAGSAGVVIAEALLRMNYDLGNTLFGIVGPFQALGFLLVGIGVIRDRVWTGWHRFAPLALGLYVPLVMVPSLAISKDPNLAALGGYHLCILLLGIAFSAESAQSSRRETVQVAAQHQMT